jgi:ubiquinone/menaquinone biosynthesis C-methylase UbiE
MSEDELAARIDPWLQHMRWRSDFVAWREKRLHQEFHQREALGLLQEGLQLAGMAARLHPPALGGHEQQVRYSLALAPWEREMVAREHTIELLDLGCGMGGFAVAAALAGIRVTAADYNPAYGVITALRAARYRLDMPVLVAAGEHLPLPPAAFDAATCWDVLEHVQAPARLLAELARVVRPGGVVLLTAINRYAFRDPHYHLPLINWVPRPLAGMVLQRMGRVKRGNFRDRQRLDTMHYFTWGSLQRLVQCHGFTLYDLDEQRVARGEVGTRHRWRRVLAARSLHTAPLTRAIYTGYRTLWQATWRVALVRT